MFHFRKNCVIILLIMKVDILFGILLTLLKKGKCSAKELADKFEVSTKTIQRYLISLEMSGVPTISTFGRNGGTEIADTFELNKWFLTSKERQRLLMHLSTSSANALDSLDKQILEKLNFSNSEENTSPQSPVIIDESDWLNSKNQATTYSREIMSAINEKHNLYINYSTSDTLPYRIISPYQFILKDNKWYIFAYCHLRKDFRIFKLSRINACIKDTETKYVNCTLTDDEIKQKINSHFEEREIELICPITKLSDVAEWLKIEEITQINDHVRLLGKTVYNRCLIYKLISLEDNIKIISPQELVDEIMLLCKKITNKYS